VTRSVEGLGDAHDDGPWHRRRGRKRLLDLSEDGEPVTRADSTDASAPVGPPGIGLIDDLEHGRRRRHRLVWVGGLSVVLVVTLPLAVGLGPVAIAPGTVTEIITYHLLGWPSTANWSGADDSIVWLVRMRGCCSGRSSARVWP
jgi:hypothetical protein